MRRAMSEGDILGIYTYTGGFEMKGEEKGQVVMEARIGTCQNETLPVLQRRRLTEGL